MFALLEKIRYSILTLALGGLFTLLAFYKILDARKLELERLPDTNVPLLAIGIALLFVSLLAGGVSQFGDAIWLPKFSRRVRKVDGGWGTQIDATAMRVTFGRLESVATPGPNNLVVLPANEFFDDECIADTDSALGAFIQTHFPKQKQDFLDAVMLCLRGRPTEMVEREGGVLKRSFLVGTTVYLPKALGTGWNILMVAVTTQRAGEGLRAEVRTIFTLTNAIETTMADHRLNNVALPLIGSGHGGLRTPAALSALVVAFIEILCRPAAHGIRTISIVIFQPSKTEKPLLSPRLVRRTVARAIDIYGL